MIKKVLEQIVDSPVLNRSQQIKFARFIRKRVDYEELKKCNLVYFLEFIIPECFDQEFSLDCISATKWTYSRGNFVVCDYDNHRIIIRNDVYCAINEHKPDVVFVVNRIVRKYLILLYLDFMEQGGL